MNRKEYETRLHAILNQAHDLTQTLHVLMTDIGDDPGSAEWSWLYEIARAAGTVSGQLYNELHPRPSALTDGNWVDPSDAYNA